MREKEGNDPHVQQRLNPAFGPVSHLAWVRVAFSRGERERERE